MNRKLLEVYIISDIYIHTSSGKVSRCAFEQWLRDNDRPEDYTEKDLEEYIAERDSVRGSPANKFTVRHGDG